MNYYFQSNTISGYRKAELTEEELILFACPSKNKEYELLRIAYKHIFSIQLCANYKVGKKNNPWQYTCKIITNDNQNILIRCDNETHNEQSYRVFLNYLHTQCGDLSHIIYTYHVSSGKTKGFFSLFDFVYVAVVIIVAFFLVPFAMYFIAWICGTFIYRPVLKKFLGIGVTKLVRDTYTPDKIPENVIP
jgi:hypothetical protein